MKLKLNIIDKAAGVLLGIKLTNIESCPLRNNLLKDYLSLRKYAKELGDEQNELVDKFNDEWKYLADQNRPEYRKAYDDLNRTIGLIMQREVEVEITPVGLDEFMSSVKDDTLTFEQIAILTESGILK